MSNLPLSNFFHIYFTKNDKETFSYKYNLVCYIYLHLLQICQLLEIDDKKLQLT